jgi:uncharacterized membrane protein (DUF2068 family)
VGIDVDLHGLPLHPNVTDRAYCAEVARKKRTRRPDNFYELLTCGWRGHALVGTDVAQIEPDDSMLAREGDGVRWYRCLRCDAWITDAPPLEPTRDRMPDRGEIEVPERGPMLRDRYVLRLIAVDRAIHVIVLTTLAVVLYTFARHDASLHRDYVNIMGDLSGTTPGESQVRGVLGFLGRAFKYSPARLIQLGLLVTAYAALEATEMVGLWLSKRWAEYLTLVATVALIPIEVYELSLRVSVFKVITLVINVAIAVYLLLAKRLFGLRGGSRVQQERHREFSGWGAIERSTPDVSAAVP